jgi:hypothetical protein
MTVDLPATMEEWYANTPLYSKSSLIYIRFSIFCYIGALPPYEQRVTNFPEWKCLQDTPDSD